ncbi:MAG: branched-chain amino acid ABC transporter permease [Candidatus Bathyarchaeia archaeon]
MISLDLLISAIISGILVGGLYTLLAMGTNLIVGIMRIINLAQGGFAMLGMFATYWLLKLYNVPPLASLPIAFIALFVVGVLISKFLFSRVIGIPAEYTILLTFGLQAIILNAAQIVWTGDFRNLGVSYGSFVYGPVSVSGEYLLAFITATVIAWTMFIFLGKTKMGKAIRAVSQDPEAAASLGINVEKIRMITAGLAIGLAGFAGVIFSIVYYIYPYIGGMFSITAIIICVFGGLGDYRGAYFGALIIGLAQSLSALFIPYGLKDAVGFAVFILVLLFRPQGIFTRR